MGVIRTFVAVEISPQIRSMARRTLQKLAAIGGSYKWVEPDNLHITVNFLGELDDRAVPDVCRLTQSAVSGFQPFALSIGRLGCFPDVSKPRVVWLGIEHGSEELAALHVRLDEAYECLRVPRDRNAYHPHLTLGRLPRGACSNPVIADFIGQARHVKTESMTVGQIVVFSSFLDRYGPTYTPMTRVNLSG